MTDNFDEVARELLGSCVCNIGENGKYYCDLHKYSNKFASALRKAVEEEREAIRSMLWDLIRNEKVERAIRTRNKKEGI